MSDETTLRKVTTGPFKNLAFPGHATAEDFDREAGKAGDCVEEADASVAYRSTLPEFHEKFTETLESMSGMKRGVNTAATDKAKARAKDPAKVKDVPASFVDFANEVKAKLSEEDWKVIDEAARNMALQVPIDASPSKRPGGIPKDCKEKAESWSTLPTDELEGKITKYADEYSLDVSIIERDAANKPTVDSLGRFIKAIMDARNKEL